MFHKPKRALTVFVMLVIAVAVSVYISVLTDRKDIDFSDESLESTVYNDYMYIDSSTSRIIASEFEKERVLHTFRLADNRLYPYSGFFLEPEDGSLISLSRYGVVEIGVNSFVSTDFTFFLNVFEEGYTTMDTPLTYRLVTKDIEVKKGTSVYRFPLREMRTPDWWYNERGMKEQDFPADPDVSRVIQIGVQNHPYAPKDSLLTIDIASVSFIHNPFTWGIVLGVLCILSIPLAYPVFFFGMKPPIQFAQEQKYSDHVSDIDLIEEYINSNFSTEGFCIGDINRETGIPLSKIRRELSRVYRRTFKQYMTELRLHEAKRLLRGTDKKIFEIAHSVGYGHVSTLNRIFKEA
ncbi:MAG: helix-turn-helix transcriptional regulator, partial [Fibrobacterota bacterium]